MKIIGNSKTLIIIFIAFMMLSVFAEDLKTETNLQHINIQPRIS